MAKRHSHQIAKPGAKFLAARVFVACVSLLAASGCVNSRMGSEASRLSSDSSATSEETSTSTSTTLGDSFRISNVSIAVPTGSGAGTVPTTTIYIDPTRSTSASGSGSPLVSSHCSGSTPGSTQTSKPCVCQFTWTDSNSTSGSTLSFKRTVETQVTIAQQALVTCPAPEVYGTEILDGTTIKVSVIAGAGNSEVFTFYPYNYVKNSTGSGGSFRDALGRSYQNISHYACYEQFKRGSLIQSRMGTGTNNKTGEPVTYPIANKFCISKEGVASSADCPNLPGSLFYSAQAYYYNFYVRASESGDVNQWNERFTCPMVKEALDPTLPSSLWPMDSTFALSMGKTTDFNVGVDAFVEVANGGGDPVSKGSKLCNGTVPSSNSSTTSFVAGCLGFAAKPNPDGSCPYFRDSSGGIRFTYRLRRFVALYPPLFGVDGKAPNEPQKLDTIYVLDRPVTPPPGNDILKPFTMRGPKPCPFALFDSKGVLKVPDPLYSAYGGYLPTYGSTNNSLWNGTNVDGIEFPNYDSPNSCSASLPLVKTDPYNVDLATFSVGTLNVNNPVLKRQYVRPITSWAPHYEEDLEFQACAPQAAPLKDPPLHFAKDPTTGNVAWCAESYPSQNDHVPALDKLFDPNLPLSSTNTYIGHVRPFTSHVAKHSASANCRATIPSSIPGGSLYPSASTTPSGAPSCDSGTVSGVARHPSNAKVDTKNVFSGSTLTGTQSICSNQTCDRTTIPAGPGWQSFPLLATPSAIEQAIASDTTYGCMVTFDNNGPATGKKTPKEGCCGPNVQLYTGLASGSSTATKEVLNTNAHLEPDAPCLTPKY